MGEVYRARDTRLDREVAIKILPETFALDPDRVARFQREAKTLALLNHPNIAQVFGLEQAGDVHALAMELVPGEDLSQRIARGAIPLDEVLPIAKQIAEALEAAHEQGIIHRDLKPANIKVRPDGTVKVLDFGLAKAIEGTGDAGRENLSQSPTITTPAMTQLGMILGTAAYMSPEQARGKPLNRRTDIWAFGCVLYEMLTGTRAFVGDDVSDVLASVLAREPDWSRLPSTLSPALGTYLKRCLHKSPKERIGDVQDLRLALTGAFDITGPPTAAAVVATPSAGWRRVGTLTTGAIVVGAVVTTTMLWRYSRAAELTPPRVSRLLIAPTGSAALTATGDDLAITPDGSRVVYVGNRGTQLFVRALNTLEPVAVFTGDPYGPFVSSDGLWIGFWDNFTQLKKVAITGGPAITLTTADSRSRGAVWGPEDAIIFATNSAGTGLQKINVKGEPTVLTRPDRAQGEADHLWPDLLPGGRAVLFTITTISGGLDAAQVAVLDLQTGTHKVLLRGGSHAHYVSSVLGLPVRPGSERGHLVYAAAGALWAVPFDLAQLEIRGTPVPVVPEVVTNAFGAADAAVAGDGTLAYVSGGVAASSGLAATRTLVWVDRQGRETPIPAPPRPYVYPRLSPDGTRIAVFTPDQAGDIWLWDLGRATLTPVTFDPGVDNFPVWTRDGRRMIFTSERTGTRNLFWQAADGTGGVERLTESPNRQNGTAVSPDGRLIFTEVSPTSREDVMEIALDETHRVRPLVHSSSIERNGVVSSDGRWLAYEANDSGRFEIWVRPFPDVNTGHWRVSTDGGTRPLWAPGGQELIYVAPTGSLMHVAVGQGPTWAPTTTPTVLVKESYSTGGDPGRSYDISADGQRFLMIKQSASADQNAPSAGVIVVQHWVEELKRLVPTK